MVGINKEDGVLVLKMIEEQLGQKLPKTGLLAGQSVASVLLYLKKKSLDIVINDYDIFLPVANRKMEWDFIPQTSSEQHMISEMSVARGNDFISMKSIDILKAKLIDIKRNKVSGLKKDTSMGLVLSGEKSSCYSDFETNDQEDYFNYEDIMKAKINSLYRRKNRIVFKEKLNMNAYRINQVFRIGLLNYVYVSSSVNPMNSLSAMNIINNFDINCTQVAIDLRTKEIYYTNNFIYFLNSMEMILLRTNKPDHSFIRFMKKKEEHGYYGNDEYAAMVCSTIKELNNELPQTILRDMDIYRAVNINKVNKNKAFGFGKGYIEKFNSTSGIKEYGTLKIETRKIISRYNLDNPKGRDLSYLNGSYDLGTINFRNDASDYILSGKHFHEMEKSLGLSISGYINYIGNNVPNVLMKEFKIGGAKNHGRRITYLTERKVNTRTKMGFADELILNGNESIMKGALDRKNLDDISRMTYEHPGIESYFLGMNLIDVDKLNRLLRAIEKRNKEVFYFIELEKNIDLSRYKTATEAISDLAGRYKEFSETLRLKSILKKEPDIAEIEIDGYLVKEIISQGELDEESNVQSNCVRNYAHKISSGKYFILSIRNIKNLFERYTLEITYSKRYEKYISIQYRGKRNTKPSVTMDLIRDKFLKWLNKPE